jgi:hydroxymethylpyrimidine/phosphomethylpyrimidine kinase
MRTALTIAGSDSGGGAGIQADLKTFAAHGVFGTSAITAVTAQNTVGVTMIEVLSPEMVRAQIAAVAADLPPAATKIGMLASAAIVSAVAASLDEHQLPHVVLDTVMIAKSRASLLDPSAVEALRRELLPRAGIVTPNIPEAEALTGLSITSVADLHKAARMLVDQLGVKAAVVKGGHLEGPAIDVFVQGREVHELRAERIVTPHTHGTGCTFSAAIAARLALGDDLLTAVRAAKAYVTRAIAHAPGLGAGHGPLQHFV